MVSHYQALLEPNKEYKNLSIVELITILRDSDASLDEFKGVYHIYPLGEDDVEVDDIWATGTFVDEPSIFPLMPYGNFGFTLSLKGKTYHLSYDENDMLTVGIDTSLFSIENEDWAGDCVALYDIIWEGNVSLLFGT